MAGFLWGSNSPYLRGVWAKVLRAPVGLDPDYALIGSGEDANPAHIIYESLTNTDWGMGASATIIDVASFEAAAVTLHGEEFGLSMIWTRQTTIESFIGEILDHIQAMLFVNPRTGLLTLKLIRDDFDRDTLPVFTPDEATLAGFQRKSWGETVNEIVVTWTNPENESEETTTIQDLANIAIQGGIVSDARNYYGVRNRTLAAKLGARDLRTASHPLASCEISIDRRAWDLLPGAVIKVTWPEHGLSELIMRVNRVDYGKTGNSKVKASLVEDIFSLTTAAYVLPPETEWTDPSEDPDPIVHTRIITLPAFMTVQAGGASAEYPEALAGVLASQPGFDTMSYELVSRETLSNGTLAWTNIGTHRLIGRATLSSALAQEGSTATNAFTGLIGGPGPTVAGFVFIGDAADSAMEIAMVDSYNSGTGLWTLARGCLDTTPKEWSIDTPVWFVDSNSDYEDLTTRSAGQTVNFKLLSQTSKGMLAEADAPTRTATLGERPHLPNRPANVKLGTVGFGTFDAEGLSSVSVTWANRNRTMEDSQVVRWTEATVTPETGQTTTVRVLAPDRTVLTTHAGLTGTSFSVPIASFGTTLPSAIVRVTAVRDGFESLQGHEIAVRLRNPALRLSGDATDGDDLLLLSGDVSGRLELSGE